MGSVWWDQANVPEYMTPGEVAALFHVRVPTVRAWVRKGKLHPTRTPGQHRRFLTQEVMAAYHQQGKAPDVV